MAIMRARMLHAARTCHIENPLFRVTDFHRQQRKLSAQGSFIGCTLTYYVMSGGHVCDDYGFLFKSAVFCSVPRTIFFICPTVLLPCESFGKILDPFLKTPTFEVLSVAWITRDSAV